MTDRPWLLQDGPSGVGIEEEYDSDLVRAPDLQALSLDLSGETSSVFSPCRQEEQKKRQPSSSWRKKTEEQG